MQVCIAYCSAVGFTQQMYYKTSRMCFAIAAGLLQKMQFMWKISLNSTVCIFNDNLQLLESTYDV